MRASAALSSGKVALSQKTSYDKDETEVEINAPKQLAGDCKRAGRTIAGLAAHNRGQIARPQVDAFTRLDFQ